MPDGLAEARDRQRRWDALQRWCAERGHGSWALLRDACAHLDLDAIEGTRKLAALGHLELSWSRGRWAAAPLCLVQLEEPPGRLLLTGAVTADIPGRLDAAFAEHGVDAVLLGPFAQGGRGPSSWHVECDPDDWPAIERAADLPVVTAFARRLATLLPAADAEVVGSPYTPDDRIPAAVLDPETLGTVWGAPIETGRAVLQLLVGRIPVWWVRDGSGRARRLPGGEWAPYVAGRGRAEPLVRYDELSGVLAVDAAAPLPPLHARAACLCSGRLPGRAHFAPGRAEDRHRAVPRCVADAICASLGQSQELAA